MTDTQEGPAVSEVTLTLNGNSTVVKMPQDMAVAILEQGAPAVIYQAGPGEHDPEAPTDSFSYARQHVMNAINELRNAAFQHPMLQDNSQPLSQARTVADNAAALVYNMLAQAGILEYRALEQQNQMAEMAQEKSIELPPGVEA